MQNNSQLRVGVIGCGYQGRNLVNAANQVDGMQVVACADPDIHAASAVARLASAATPYTSTMELLQQAEVDALLIATPHHLLYETSLAGLEAGKHLLVEKPCGMDERELRQVEEVASRRRLCYMAGYSIRFVPLWQQVHHLLYAGAAGEVRSICGAFLVGPLDSGWIATPETGGGPLMYVGSHLVDEILWCVNDRPVEVIAQVRYRPDTRAEEWAAFEIHFDRGAVAICLVGQNGVGLANNVDIYGSAGRIGVRGGGLFDYAAEVESKALAAYATPAVLRIRPVDSVRQTKHMAQLTEFSRAIQEKRQPAVTLADARRVLAVLDAVQRSAHTGATVRVDADRR